MAPKPETPGYELRAWDGVASQVVPRAGERAGVLGPKTLGYVLQSCDRVCSQVVLRAGERAGMLGRSALLAGMQGLLVPCLRFSIGERPSRSLSCEPEPMHLPSVFPPLLPHQ